MTKTQRIDYINRVKRGIEVYEAMAALKDSQELKITYNGERYNIHCSEFVRKNNEVSRIYSINDTKVFGKSMNIDMEKSGKSYLLVFVFDLFKNQTTHKVDFSKVEIVKEAEEVVATTVIPEPQKDVEVEPVKE